MTSAGLGDAGEALLARLLAAAPEFAPAIESEDSIIERLADVPLYPRHQLWRLTVALPQRPLMLDYADDGVRALAISSPDGVAELNRASGLRLASGDVPEYVRFWFGHAVRRTLALVESGSDCSWLQASESDPEMLERRAGALRAIGPIVDAGQEDGHFLVDLTAIEQRELVRIRLRVSPDGDVEELQRSSIMTDVPVPYVLP